MLSLSYIITLGFGASVLGYYLSDSNGVFSWFLPPIKRRIAVVMQQLGQRRAKEPDNRLIRARYQVLLFIFNGLSCRICLGQHVAIWAHALLSGQWPWEFDRFDWFAVLAANGVHLILEDARLLTVKLNTPTGQAPNVSDEA